MTYEEMLAHLLGAARFGMDFGLGRVRATLGRLGDPHRAVGQVAHIGGTNGKGSTAAMLEAMLRGDGRRTGLYTSPHLSRFTERIRVAGIETGRDAVAARYERVMAVAPADLTFFEQVTVTAFLTFAEEGVEALVLEVGLGGRLDATNVVDADVAAVVGVAMDHEEVLGRDLLGIAREKAGIWKPGRVAVIGDGGEPAAVPVLEAEAAARGSRVVHAGRRIPAGWTIGLRGPHQVANAACALAVAAELGVSEEARRAGLAAARWPGRIEELGGVLLDAAHNPQGAAALAEALAEDPRPRVLLVGVSADKDAAALVGPLLPGARAAVVTEAPSPRALPASRLAAVVPGAVIEPDPEQALARARELAGPDGLVVAFGSLFLVGDLRARLTGEARDPVPLSDPGRLRGPGK